MQDGARGIGTTKERELVPDAEAGPMGDPRSEDPEQWPNVINRTWVDVRRHAANVSGSWTPEEAELQMRIWEIRLEETTDRPRPESTR